MCFKSFLGKRLKEIYRIFNEITGGQEIKQGKTGEKWIKKQMNPIENQIGGW